MRENIANQSPMETLSFSNFQKPFDNISRDQKPVLIGVSSNVYYGYQPLRVENFPEAELMHTEDIKRPVNEMDTNQCESRLVSRKRTRDSVESNLEVWKKRRQNEPLRSVRNPQRCTLAKTCLEEELLRETHGCSYYHWVSSNI